MKGQIVIDTDKCPLATDTKETEKHLECSGCGKFFLHDKRGRKPNACEWYRELEKKAQVKRKKQKAEARKNVNMIAIPRLEPFSSLDELKPGMVVYTMPTAFSREVTKLRFAKDYKVLSVEDDGVTVIRNAKLGHKNYPVKVNLNRIFNKTGQDYVDKTDEDESEDEDDE